MTKGWKRAFLLCGALLLLVLVNVPLAANAQEAQGAVGIKAGQYAPDFELVDHQGNKHKLSEFRGQPVLLNFWASWCTPCRLEMEDLADSAKHYQGKVQFFGVNLADQDSPSVSAAFLKKFGVEFPNVLDEEGKVSDQYHVLVIPTSFLIDKDGKIVQMVQGPLFNEEIDKLFKKVLN
ncbi:peroxiredoxin [Tumebacillus sp. BK434]|uniref:TlpA family protein disulfide reductase n=1 Tax=Tumebacillus sp. BK434 TaxID=2512169 RepID=UPI0010E1F228|nr:TlpA disulfide reductase family protein [Tumebacillus sp. BK434]TCP59550.1 peroxiredoxin [Tumebacillus sp. BK434]